MRTGESRIWTECELVLWVSFPKYGNGCSYVGEHPQEVDRIYLGINCYDVCNLLSNDSAKEKGVVYTGDR